MNVRYDVRGPVAQEATRMVASGEDIIRLNIGNPAAFGITAPEHMVRIMESRAGACQAYSESKGNIDAREAIAAYASRKNISGATPEFVYTGNGVSELIQICMDVLLDSGDEVLIPTPDYPLWTAAATMAGGKAVHYICDEKSSWYPDIEDIAGKVTDRTKAIVIINPNNPTGAVYPEEILLKIAEIAEKNNLVIFADEIYDRLLLNGKKHVSIASLAGNVLCVTLNGLSKSHMLCGYRIGWMVLSGDTESAKDFIEGIDMLTNMRLCSNVPGQSVIAEALSGTGRAEEYFVSGGRIYEQVNTAYDMLCDIPGVHAARPDAAFYIFPGIDTERYAIESDERFALDFLRKKKVLIVPGSGFNWKTKGYFRVVCLPEEKVLAEAVSRLDEYLREL